MFVIAMDDGGIGELGNELGGMKIELKVCA